MESGTADTTLTGGKTGMQETFYVELIASDDAEMRRQGYKIRHPGLFDSSGYVR